MLNFRTLLKPLLISSFLLSMTLSLPIFAMEENGDLEIPASKRVKPYSEFSKHDHSGRTFRHYSQLCYNIESTLQLNEIRGIHHPALTEAYDKLKGLGPYHWSKREAYINFF